MASVSPDALVGAEPEAVPVNVRVLVVIACEGKVTVAVRVAPGETGVKLVPK